MQKKKLPAKTLFTEVESYCKKNGLIDKLNLSLTNPEKNRFDSQKTKEEGLSELDAVHCLVDKKRTFYFINEILKIVGGKDSVLEVGIGTGILSFASALKTKKVVGIEMNKSIFNLANNIKQYVLAKKKFGKKFEHVEIHHADGTKFKTKDKFSVLISENIYTGMFYEKQVQIINSLRKFLKTKHTVIPSQMISSVSLTETQFPQSSHEHLELFVPLEHKKDLSYKKLSEYVIYNNLDFSAKIKETIEYSGDIYITKTGVINSLLIQSDVIMPSGFVVKGKNTIFFNNDIILGLKPEIRVKKGDRVKLTLKYKAGDNPHDAQITAEKVL